MLREQDIEMTKITQVFKRLLFHINLLEDSNYDLEKLFLKQMHMKQLMNLKSKGRFIEETKIYESEFKKAPSTKSQKRVVSALDYLMIEI
jgi:hypothetical protein